MVGGRTLHDEDPRLLVRSSVLRGERLARGLPENPAKIGVASHLRFRPASRFLSTGPARRIVFVPRACVDAPPPDVEVYRLGDQRVDLVDALARLGELGIRKLLVEGGGTLNFELLRLGLVDEIQVYLAPLILGGASAPTLADGEGLPRDQALALQRVSLEALADGGVLARYKVEPT
jgi:2,5-diamino-6-(ribosylamino)-4(3H)-pyrimidinone 5'-phosphate reductase